ncbi:MAG: hypothetical protein ACKVZJ_04570 [Phycisphaerales bacterium]
MSLLRIVSAVFAALALGGSAGAEFIQLSGAGTIPDGTSPNPGTVFGPTATLTGFSIDPTPMKDVVLSLNRNAARCSALRVGLNYTPTGGPAVTAFVFNRLGANSASQPGFEVPMNVDDVFLAGTGDIWFAAESTAIGNSVPGGVYDARFNPLHGPQSVVLFSSIFGNLPGNGTWTLRVDKNYLTGDIDAISNATITITPQPPAACVGDLNGDGVVNTADLTRFLGRFGQPC